MRMRVCLFAALLALGGVVWAGDEETDRRLKELEEQNREILERLKQSEGRNTKLEGEVERMRARENELLESDIEKYLEATREVQGGSATGRC